MFTLKIPTAGLTPQQERDLRRYATRVNAIFKGFRRRRRQARTRWRARIKFAARRAILEGRSPGEAINAVFLDELAKAPE